MAFTQRGSLPLKDFSDEPVHRLPTAGTASCWKTPPLQLCNSQPVRTEPRTRSCARAFFARYSLPILMAFFFAAPFLIQGAHRAIRSNTNKVADWLPKTFKETLELRWFRKHFVADQFVVVSWPGCTLGDDPSLPDAKPDDPRIERLAKYLVPNEVASSAAAIAHGRTTRSISNR